MLAELQQHLIGTYALEQPHDVRDFLITDACIADAIAPGAVLAGSRETLLLAEADGELAMSLFLDGDLLARLAEADPLSALKPRALADLWLVLEGLSHFNTVAFKAGHDREVSLLELELQGEVDKYVTSMLLALEQDDRALASRLHGWLFDEVRFRPDLEPDALERYRAANQFAARFCHRLDRTLRSDDGDVLAELRRFFRLPIADKISHINVGGFRH